MAALPPFVKNRVSGLCSRSLTGPHWSFPKQEVDVELVTLFLKGEGDCLMIALIPMNADHVVGLRIRGKIEVSDFDEVVGLLDEKFKHHDKLQIYAEIESIGGMSLEAFFKDIQYSLRNFRRFDKEAVVSDKAWLKAFVSVADKLFPSIEARHFSFDERSEAQAWIGS